MSVITKESNEGGDPWQALVVFTECLACQKIITDSTFQAMRNYLEELKPSSSSAVSGFKYNPKCEQEED